VISGVKGRRKVKKTKTGDFLRICGINELVVNMKKSSVYDEMLYKSTFTFTLPLYLY